MKILCIADTEQRELWDHWSTSGRRMLEGVQLILSAGDLKPDYLEFLVTMLSVPCLYVRGNHDDIYHSEPPQGCLCIEDKIVKIYEDPLTGRTNLAETDAASKLRRFIGMDTDPDEGRVIVAAGLGGSMRYREGRDMYTEKEMVRRVRRIDRKLAACGLCRDNRTDRSGEGRTTEILLTHAPCFGYGDMDDLPHRGFDCFNDLLKRWQPDVHCFGHVHREYGNFRRESVHPSGTRLINVSGMYILEV